MKMLKQKDFTAYVLLTMAPLFWAGNTIVAKIISFGGKIPPCCLASMRWGIAFFFYYHLLGKKLIKIGY